ncbi:MAG: O-antigen ligase family protein [Flavobacteriia bacterium]|nr:O-antigen ligase family protein [Flavobacteriia bacterium]
MSKSSTSKLPIGLVLSLLIGITPFISTDASVEHYLLPRTIYWSALAAIGGFLLFTLKQKSLSITYTGLIWVAFTLWSLTGLGLAYSLPEFWYTFSRYSLYASILIIGTIGFKSKKISFDDVSKGLVLLSIVGGLLTWASVAKADNITEAFSPFGHKNFASAVMLVSLLGSLRTAQLNDKKWSYVAILGIVIATVTIILLRTRGIWIASIVSSIALLVGSRVFRPKGNNKSVIPLKYIALGFGILITGFAAVIAQPKVEEAVFDTTNIDIRIKEWDHSIKMFSENPVSGVGAGQWKIHFPKYGLIGTDSNVAAGKTAILRPHNDYFWMLSEGGLPSLLLYLSFFGWVIVSGIKSLYKTDQPHDRMRLLSALAMIVAFMTYALAEFPIERVDVAVPVFLAAAFLTHNGKSIGLPKPLTILLGVAFGAFALNNGVGRLSQEKFVTKILTGNERQDPMLIIQNYDKVDFEVYNLDPFANPLSYFNGLSYLALSQAPNQKNQQVQRLAISKQSFDQALAIHPWHVATYIQYGNWYKIQNKLDEAMEMYQKGYEISPYSEEIRLNRAEIKMRQGNYDAALYFLLNITGVQNEQKYGRLVIQSLRAHSGQSTDDTVNDFFLKIDVDSMNDNQLYGAFLRHRDRALSEYFSNEAAR